VFDGVQEDGHPPSKVSAINIIRHVDIRFQWIANGGQPAKDDLAKRIGIKWLSILFRLEYWKVTTQHG
jgi:hypothetical protein